MPISPTHLALVIAGSVVLLAAAAGRGAEPASAPKKDLPSADELPSVTELPDPFLFKDGTRVKTKADWDRRRAELLDLVLGYEYGRMPPAPPSVTAEENPSYTPPKESGSNAKIPPATQPVVMPEGMREVKLLLKTGPEGKVQIPLIMAIPAGKGPFPVVVRIDLNWGRAKPEVVANVVRRGYILAEFDRTAVAPDKDGRDAGVYPLYPDYDWRALSAWAWGAHRVIDYLVTRPDVDARHIVVTGHSRGGKAALLAGATDTRVALTVPNNSGAGGAGCFRHQAPKSEDIARITKSFPFWFSPNFTQFVGKVDRMPFDQHSVKALVAPRALLSTEALGDLWANPEGTQVTHSAAKEVYDFLGAGDRIGIYFREGKHEHNPADFDVLLDYADKVFFGKSTDRKFDKLAFPEAPKPWSWKAPEQ